MEWRAFQSRVSCQPERGFILCLNLLTLQKYRKQRNLFCPTTRGGNFERHISLSLLKSYQSFNRLLERHLRRTNTALWGGGGGLSDQNGRNDEGLWLLLQSATRGRAELNLHVSHLAMKGGTPGGGTCLKCNSL